MMVSQFPSAVAAAPLAISPRDKAVFYLAVFAGAGVARGPIVT